jgi:hypothetical protein
MKTIFVCLLSITLFACTSTKKSTNSVQSSQHFAPSEPKSTDDGLSFATAIVITEKGESAGVAAEYKWIREHYTDYKIKEQALSTHDKKPYDVITIVFPDNKELPLYFDISNFFGKF